MNSSNTIGKLALALSSVQAKFPTVAFDAKNPFLKNKYATLGAIVRASLPILQKAGLSIAQFPISQEGRIGVRTILMHESGEYIEDTITVVPDASKGLSVNQSSGVTITYMRRYAWAAVLGLVADEDNDGDTHPGTMDNVGADAQVSELMKKRQWTSDQTQAISVMVLDAGLDPLDRDDAVDILDYSVLPGDASVKTIQSWFKHYMKADGTVLDKSNSANEAYNKAKNGGK